MDQGLKERLVGAAVLVAIAVWLIPWVLDGPEAGVETPASSLAVAGGRGADADAHADAAPRRRRPSRASRLRRRRAAPAHGAPPRRALSARAAEPAETHGRGANRRSSRRPVRRRARRSPSGCAAGVRADASTEAGSGGRAAIGWCSSAASARKPTRGASRSARGRSATRPRFRAIENGGRTLYRVRVGPQATRAAADAAASALPRSRDQDARVVAAREPRRMTPVDYVHPVAGSGLGSSRCLARVYDRGAVAAHVAGRDRLGVDASPDALEPSLGDWAEAAEVRLWTRARHYFCARARRRWPRVVACAKIDPTYGLSGLDRVLGAAFGLLRAARARRARRHRAAVRRARSGVVVAGRASSAVCRARRGSREVLRRARHAVFAGAARDGRICRQSGRVSWRL